MLHHKGMSKTEVEKAIAEINKEEYRSMIGKELNKKRKSLKGIPVRYGQNWPGMVPHVAMKWNMCGNFSGIPLKNNG